MSAATEAPTTDVFALLLVENIDDPDTYRQYERGFDRDHFKQMGGELLVKSESPKEIEGTWTHQRVVLLRFPSQEHFDTWYASPEYSAVKGLRLASGPMAMACFAAGRGV
ncbi:MAG TPA: DUF1330 domain-containing protein [Solirubrobacterales bacterium]|jgi:uncharacterized protein (DUF1330 family)|nr:DUF1330 domain-containing protein [Solirubrobacterales bacterium]